MAMTNSGIEVNAIPINFDHLNEALKGMADHDTRGKKWMKDAFMRAGTEAFKPVVRASRSFAPRGRTGNTKRYLTATRGYYNHEPKVGKSGKVNKSSKNQYMIDTTLSPKFDQANRSKTWRGKSLRYPFMNEVGVPSQTYGRMSREPYRNLHTVHRKAPRKAMAFMHRGLGTSANRVVNIWAKRMNFYIGLYAKTTYKSLRGARTNYINTRGGKGKKWL
ncbi:hypothetical protein WKI02_07860 [Vibrio alginolyticus]|uniref:hypothetical protein n=1 Tax=Vibrio alginolyticus TaxID=663 RepID=UPI0037543E18